MLLHPERREDEVFIGNTKPEEIKDDPKLRGLKTIRLGKVAYSITGKKLNESERLFPLFINKKEELILDRQWGEELKRIRRGC